MALDKTNEKKVATFEQRFNTLVAMLAEKGIRRNDIAKKLGVSKQTISAWCTGKRSPRKPTIVTIAQAYNVNEAWLCGYNIQMINDANRTIDAASELDAQIIEAFAQLTYEQKETLINFITIMLQ